MTLHRQRSSACGIIAIVDSEEVALIHAVRDLDMKIGIFTDTYKPQINGVVTSICLMDEMLRAHGHETYIFTIEHPQATPVNDPEHVFRIRSFRFWGNSEHRIGLLYSRKALRLARSLGIELVHSHAPFSLGVFGHITAKRMHIPEVHTYHTMLEDYGHYLHTRHIPHRRIARNYSRIFCNLANGIIVPTEKVRDKLLSYGVRPPIYVLPTGIDLSLFSQSCTNEQLNALRIQLGYSETDSLLLFVGRIGQEKSIDTLLKYHADLIRHNPRYKLLIVGSGDYSPQLEALSTRLGLRNSVRFVGQQDYASLPQYYQIADCFVIASKTETQGLVVLEALASGVPVVCIDDESFHSTVIPGENGFFFRDQESYVSSVQQLTDSSDLRANMSVYAKEHARGFSAETFYARLTRIYADVHSDYKRTRS